MNLENFHLHLIIGSREEDVRRTNNQEGSKYKVYNFTKRQELHEKLEKMGDDELFFRKIEFSQPERYKEMSSYIDDMFNKNDHKVAMRESIREREVWKKFNKNHYVYDCKEDQKQNSNNQN